MPHNPRRQFKEFFYMPHNVRRQFKEFFYMPHNVRRQLKEFFYRLSTLEGYPIGFIDIYYAN